MIVTIHNKGIIKNTIVIKITKGLKMASEAHFVQLKKIKTHHQIKSIWVSYQRHRNNTVQILQLRLTGRWLVPPRL